MGDRRLGRAAGVTKGLAGIALLALLGELGRAQELLPSNALPGDARGPQAVQWLAEERWPEALALADALVTESPYDARSLNLLAECCWRAGQLDRAAAIWKRCLDLHPRNPRALAGQAWWALANGSFEEASARASAAVASGPDSPGAWAAQAAVAAATGRRADAQAAVRAAIGALGPRERGPEGVRLRHVLERVRTRLANPAQVDSDARKGRLPLRIEDGLPLVAGRARGVDGADVEVPLLIDTGGSFALGLDHAVAPSLEIALGGRRALRAGGRRHDDARVATLGQLDVGEWTLRQVPSVVFPIDANRPYRGILGPVLSEDRVLILNFRREAVAFLDAFDVPWPKTLSSGEVRTRTWMFGDGKTLLDVWLGSAPVLALIDSGTRRSGASRRIVEEGRWGPMRLGSMRFDLAPPPTFQVLDEEISPSLGVEVSLLLGMDFLTQFGIVTLDARHRAVTWTPKQEDRRK